MKAADLKIGMHFSNQGTVSLKVYDGLDGTGSVMTKVKPGAYIGQIADIRTGPGGTVLDFVSEKISASGSIVEKAEVFMFSWLPDSVKLKIAGGVRFKDLAPCITAKALQEQQEAMGIAEANGRSLSKSIVKVAKDVGETVQEGVKAIIPWDLVWIAGGIYVVANYAGSQKKK